MRSDEIAGNNELHKNQEFLPNLCEIAFFNCLKAGLVLAAEVCSAWIVIY